MDNPFAKTNAEHLLEPMFEIANKYKIQLVCFSGIGGSAVYNFEFYTEQTSLI